MTRGCRFNENPEGSIEAAAPDEIEPLVQKASLNEKKSLAKKANGRKKHSPTVLSQKKQINKEDRSESMVLLAMEKKLARIKELMERKMISDSEYKKRKERLLSQL